MVWLPRCLTHGDTVSFSASHSQRRVGDPGLLGDGVTMTYVELAFILYRPNRRRIICIHIQLLFQPARHTHPYTPILYCIDFARIVRIVTWPLCSRIQTRLPRRRTTWRGSSRFLRFFQGHPRSFAAMLTTIVGRSHNFLLVFHSCSVWFSTLIIHYFIAFSLPAQNYLFHKSFPPSTLLLPIITQTLDPYRFFWAIVFSVSVSFHYLASAACLLRGLYVLLALISYLYLFF